MTGNPQLKLVLTVVISLLLASTATAQVYKTVDEDGKVTFTDSPENTAKPVEITEPNTVKSIDVPIRVKPRPNSAAQGYRISISSPSDGDSVSGLTTTTVTGKLTPALKPNHQIQLLVDGASYNTSRQANFSVSNLERGPHTLQLVVIDRNGATLNSSSVVTISSTRPNNLINIGNDIDRPAHLPSRPGNKPPHSRPNISPRN